MPGAASANGRRLSSGPRGSCPEAITSIVPSPIASTTARRLASLLSGGESRANVRKSVSSRSDSMKCAGVTPAVTATPRDLAARTKASPAAVVTWRK
jgi:hypothetical protein